MDSNQPDAERSPDGAASSLWLDTSPGPTYDALDGDLEVDTAVVGGGIVGITTASLLAAAGRSVAVLERDRILAGVTGHTTAKLTSQHGLLYDHLIEHFGETTARRYADANEAAIDHVEATVAERNVDCGFARTPAYTYVEADADRRRVRAEVDAARRLGLPASYTESTSLPFDVAAAVRFDDQARFHPRAYLLSLAEDVVADGGRVFEGTRALDVEDGTPCRVTTDRGVVTADDVVVATCFPFVDRALYFARLAPKRSYVVAARLRDDPPDGMYYRPADDDTYFSVRPHPASDDALVLFGGQNHRTAHGGSTAERYRALRREVRNRFDVESFEYRWSTQDWVSVDRVPFVGRHAPHVENVYVATGFGGWGLTNGTAAGILLADLVRGRENDWREVYRPTRFKPAASARSLLEHGFDATKHTVEAHVGRPPRADVAALDTGDAGVFDVDGEAVAVSRDEDGALHAVSAVCTHMGCHVEWNDAEGSWDCPCHGSRFDRDGTVLDPPAVTDLEEYDPSDLP